MTAKELTSKLKSRIIWINLGLMAAYIMSVVILAAVGTDIYTHHGEEVTIPDLTSKNVDNMAALLEKDGLTIVVTDTSYNRNFPADCILQQTPAPGEKVKSGRTVYVTINASSKPTLIVPDIIDNSSVREATAMLKILGFKVGEPQYTSGEKGWVYGVTCHGRSLNTGDRVPIDDMVVLIIGSGEAEETDSYEVIDAGGNEPTIDESGDIDPFEEVR